jgi:subtilisin family serine protease
MATLAEPAGLIVQFAPEATPATVRAALEALGGEVTQWLRAAEPGAGPLAAVSAGPGMTAEAAIELLAPIAGISFAEADAELSIAAVSNDPRYANGGMWGMLGDTGSLRNAFGSQANEAWAAGQLGSMKTVVGVVDTGIDYRHQDLYLNVWLNQNEIPALLRSQLVDIDRDGLITFRDLNASANAKLVSDINRNGRIDAGDLLNDSRWENGIDEDRNGLRDDLVGWDFANNDNDPFDDNGHGTHVSGTIGASGGNGIGVAGVAWNVQMVALKFMAANGSGSTSAAVRALDYFTSAAAAATKGENFVATNNSWGGGAYSQAVADAVARGAKQDILFIAAAGNGGADGVGDNNDVLANWPSNHNTSAAAGYDAVISVAALTSTGARAGFSNYGASTVDIAAPGQGILSTLPGDSYGSYSGTSMAAPHVTGAAVLYAAANPNASAAQIKAALLGSTAPTASMQGADATGGRLDIGALMATAPGTTPTPPATPAAIIGTSGNDVLAGTAAAEVICGIPAGAGTLGRGSIDRLTGGAGNDTFILGDARGVFYDDGAAANAGRGDYAQIMDFTRGDRIQLSDDVATYFLASMTLGGVAGLGILADLNRNGRYDAADELVGHVANVASLGGADFIFA